MSNILVTGSSSGIGFAISKLFNEKANTVIEWDISSTSPVDVSSTNSVQNAAQRISQDLDAVILAAGVSRMAKLVDTTDDDWDFQMNVNAFGVFNCLRSLYPKLKDGGSIVVIDSCGGLKGAPYFSAYCASKFAVTGLIESASVEFAERKIRINGVCPMYVRTPMESRELAWEAKLRGITPEEVFKGYETSTPLGRVSEPEEIAKVVEFLVSDASSYMTGSMLTVSGGAHLGFTL
jgi:NAD(P)-dependent dehydrogenase (short-subunit alcohol dehydrogenase family)